ncbi:exopolysaccharide biosynthesis protein [Sulfitobacter sp. SK012]|uniref:sugar transferase n=1 Tax=Sulfitobacter sp. SK012 TaxID=1389005 RepID=UPI000E0AD5D3|nr:sugar transferase [Sulfitobacter sp. SK012]AXI46695.1 exopolysaccharide biosynthesis protein [Sulfitobacter sp. SK012]
MTDQSSTTPKADALFLVPRAARIAQSYRGAPKRVLDVVLSIVLLPIILPVILIFYVAVRLEGGSGFFGHRRIGRKGQVFTCWKIRTMVPDADKKLTDLLRQSPAARRAWDKDSKLQNDPRVTKLGVFLRETSLDELPQIWNVLRGEMSLIGPRPVTAPELERYGTHQRAYLSLRPGVTGLWQVSGRNDVSYDMRVEMDARYARDVSFTSDVRILFQTAGAVTNRTGC